MKKIAIVAVALAIASALLWPHRLELMLRLAVTWDKVKHPIGDNRAVPWQQGPAEASPGGSRPNIVLIVADDLGFNDLSFNNLGLNGGEGSTGGLATPAIDAIAQQGVAFTQAYAGNAVCAPSRAMLMTGRYSTRFGFEFTPAPAAIATMFDIMFRHSTALHQPIINIDAVNSMPPFAELGMPGDEITLAELLRDAGYHTVHIGKWHLGRGAGMRPEHQGFAESLLMESGLYLPVDDAEAVNARQDFDPLDRALWLRMRYAASFNGSAPFAPRGYLTDYYTDQAVTVIEANRHRPFFLYLAHWAVHSPLQALKSDYEALAHIEDHRLRVYTAMIRALDRSVQRVLQALKDNGLEDNTIVLFTSDNGGPGYIGLPDINHPYRGWKLTLFEGGLRVPLFLRWPGTVSAGTRFEQPVSHLDIFSTAAAAAGAGLPDDRVVDGADLAPYLDGGNNTAPHDVIVWREGYYQAIRSGPWKLMVSERPRKTWLYDLAADPLEQHNLAAQRPDIVAELKQRLAAHNAQQAPSRWPSVADMPIMVDKTAAEPVLPGDEYVYWPN